MSTYSRKRKSRSFVTPGMRMTKRRLTYGRSTIPRSIASIRTGPLQAKLRTKLIYFSSITLGASTVANNSTHNFRANSLYDPDQTGTGHQPRGYDQLKALYQFSEVIGCKITAYFANIDAEKTPIVGVFISDTTSYPNDAYAIGEDGTAKVKRLGNDTNANSIATISHYVNIAKFTGSKRGSDSLKALENENPKDDVYFVVTAHDSIGSGVSAGQVSVIVRMEFDVEFTQPSKIGSS